MMVLFRCDNCNFADSINLRHVKDADEGGIVQLPNGWWAGIGTKSGKLKIFCASAPCSPGKLANEVKFT
jgi:hypothetical protein